MKHLTVLLLAVSLNATAGGLFMDDEPAGYRSKGGRHYEYDLNRPVDQLRYEVDPAAQLRDYVAPPDPYADLMEETYGQRGGGYKRKR